MMRVARHWAALSAVALGAIALTGCGAGGHSVPAAQGGHPESGQPSPRARSSAPLSRSGSVPSRSPSTAPSSPSTSSPAPVSAAAPSTAPQQVGKIAVEAFPNPVAVDQSTTISGTVFLADGDGAPNAKMTIMGLPGEPNGDTVHTNQDGKYSVVARWSQPGTYTVSVGNGLVGWQTRVVVRGAALQAAAFPKVVREAMAQFPKNLVPSPMAPTELPAAVSQSSLHYRTWDLAKGPIHSENVVFSSATNQEVAGFSTQSSSVTLAALSAAANPYRQAQPNGTHQTSTVSLGHGITGTMVVYQAPKDSAQAVSSAAVYWHEGRWDITVSDNETTATALVLQTAQNLTNYLNTLFLPVPQTHAAIVVEMQPGETASGQLTNTPAVSAQATWQRGGLVYETWTASLCPHPVYSVLTMAVAMHPYP